MLTMDVLRLLVKSIVEEQRQIMGPIALEQASKVLGLRITGDRDLKIEINTKNPVDTLSQLVEKYEELFGATSIEVCKEAIKESQAKVSPTDLPAILV